MNYTFWSSIDLSFQQFVIFISTFLHLFLDKNTQFGQIVLNNLSHSIIFQIFKKHIGDRKKRIIRPLVKPIYCAL